jgi:Asp-tRNA(Asn)/Glu-tRNA(Gln) amidotransferase A subunit family amidase
MPGVQRKGLKMIIKTTIVASLTGLLLTSAAVSTALAQEDSLEIQVSTVAEAETLIGLEFTPEERDSMRTDLIDNLASYQAMRDIPLDNSVSPALVFNPIPRGAVFDTVQRPVQFGPPPDVHMPADINELAFYNVRELSELIRTRQLTSLELTRFCLERLRKYDTLLHCVITLTEDLALTQAARADSEIVAGVYRGPLHGIPYGVKDLLAARGYPTTWGAMPYKDQVIDRDASVITKLETAGAVLVAKLSLGALAWGDVWFADTTLNPWNLTQGSSGSSAGPASAVSAGLVPFAIGSETWGSIVSPSTRCGVTGLRPTYGRVSRAGAMALSWSMDKLGPICRTVEDCALVFNTIYGPDGEDLSMIDLPFNYEPNVELGSLRIGYLKDDFDLDTAYMEQNLAALQKLRDLGADLIAIELPQMPVYPQGIILVAEAAAAFDELTRSDRDDLMVRQSKNAWPNVFRSSRFIPAVEYIQANRLRSLAIEAMARLMDSVDVYIAPSFEGDNLLLTNLTGHPCVVVPDGFDKDNSPVSITFVGRLFDEGRLLAVAKKYQQATDFHRQHPPLFK